MTTEVAYILKGFPRLSETFIANEIHLLESMGLSLRLFSIKPGEREQAHAVVSQIKAPLVDLPVTSSLSGQSLVGWLRDNLKPFARAHLRLMARKPVAYFKTLASAIVMGWRYRTKSGNGYRSIFIKEFLQAGYIAERISTQTSVKHLHAHFCHGATTVAMYVSDICGIPFSFTAHAKDIYLQKLNPGDLLARKMARSEFVVTCTGANFDHLRTVDQANSSLRCIYHGLDLSQFKPQVKPAAQTGSRNKPLILSVGRLVEKKGFDYLVQACALLRDQGRDFECLIYGGKDDYADRIIELINKLQLNEVVKLMGSVTQEELRSIYQDASVFALPCLVVENGDRDGIPNVLVEAMAMEVPVISTDISGIPELIDNEQDGLLVPEKNAEAMAAAIASILDSPDLAQRLGQAARRKVYDKFDSARTTVELKSLFDRCLEQREGFPDECPAAHCR